MSRRRLGWALPLALAALLLAGCGGASAANAPTTRARSSHAELTAGTTTTEHITVGRFSRTFIVRVPKPLPKGALPVVLMYHGVDDTAAATEKETDLDTVADAHGYLVVYLQGYDDSWNEGAGGTPAREAGVNDVTFTHDVLDWLSSRVHVDVAAIAAAGFSNGALMVQDLGCTLAGEIDLIVPVEGELPTSVSATCHPSRPVAVVEVHGTADTAIPYGGGKFNGVGGGTDVLSAPASVARWAALDHCSHSGTAAAPAASQSATLDTGCADGVSVELVTIAGGQHNWPSNFGQLVAAGIGRLPTKR